MEKLPSIYTLIESAEGEDFGDEISKINGYLKTEYPDHDEFMWDGNQLTITFKDGDDKKFSRDQLKEKISGF